MSVMLNPTANLTNLARCPAILVAHSVQVASDRILMVSETQLVCILNDPIAPRALPQRGLEAFDHPASPLGHSLDELQLKAAGLDEDSLTKISFPSLLVFLLGLFLSYLRWLTMSWPCVSGTVGCHHVTSWPCVAVWRLPNNRSSTSSVSARSSG
jgi:hypothetical protein